MVRNICVVITARPSYSRIRSLLVAIKKSKKLNLQLVTTSSANLTRYGNVEKIIEKDGFKINYKLYNLIEGDDITTPAKTTGLAIIELSSVFKTLNPDCIVTIADRFETISNAIAASYMNIPLIHIQGGEVTGNIDEKVRHSISKLSDFHFVSNEDAKKRLIKMGENKKTIFNYGCPSIDIAVDLEEINNDIISKYSFLGNQLDISKKFIVVLIHPVTTEYMNQKRNISELILAIKNLPYQVVWLWPNVDLGTDIISKELRIFASDKSSKNVSFIKNLDSTDFLKLLNKSSCLVGNSSVGIRECEYLGVPVVNIGHRQNKRARGRNVTDIKDFSSKLIEEAILNQVNKQKYTTEYIYGDGKAGKRIAKKLEDLILTFEKVISY